MPTKAPLVKSLYSVVCGWSSEMQAQTPVLSTHQEWFSSLKTWRDNCINSDANILTCERYNLQSDQSVMSYGQ